MNITLKQYCILILLLEIFVLVLCYEQPKTEDPKQDPLKALSRSKASVWVDTNRGSVFSTSIGSSHVERANKTSNSSFEPIGRSSNMLLTLLLQPTGQTSVSQAQPPTDAQESHLKPILLLLQQQQDLSELLLEKQEKIEKMNVHLQQQVKHQQLLIVDLLEQIKLFLEVINSPTFSGKTSSDMMNNIKQKHSPNNDLHHTSASSSANAVVTIPKKKGQINNNLVNYDAMKTRHRKIPPILVTSQSETVEYLRTNKTIALINPQNVTNTLPQNFTIN